MSYFKFLFKFSLFVICFFSVSRFCKQKTDNFQLVHIEADLPPQSKWETLTPAPDDLNQKFYYLAKGAQCFAFVSQDNKYILKFVRHDHLRPNLITRCLAKLPFLKPLLQEKFTRKETEKENHFTSYKIAFDQLKEETGLVYLHLNKTQKLLPKIALVDKIGIEHLISLDSYEFILQKKAELLSDVLSHYIQKNKGDDLKSILAQVIDLLAKRARLGIFDKDPDLNTNFGVLEGRVIQIDVGRFRISEQEKDRCCYIPEIKRITQELRENLSDKRPQLVSYLDDYIDSLALKEAL